MSSSTDQIQPQPVDIFAEGGVPITVTYARIGLAPMTFHMRLYLSKEEGSLRQARFALTDAEKEEKESGYNLTLLASLSTRAPEGVPGFVSTGDVAKDIRDFFGDGNPAKDKIVADAMGLYFRATQPEEFFRGV